MIGRCLTKNPRYRLQAIAEARIVIEHTLAQSEIRPQSIGDRGAPDRLPGRAAISHVEREDADAQIQKVGNEPVVLPDVALGVVAVPVLEGATPPWLWGVCET